jgi:hypothetical protein
MNLFEYKNYKKLNSEQKKEFEYYFGKQEGTVKYKYKLTDLTDVFLKYMISLFLFSIFILILYKVEIFDKSFIVIIHNAVFSLFKLFKWIIAFIIILMIIERLNFVIEYFRFIKRNKLGGKQWKKLMKKNKN